MLSYTDAPPSYLSATAGLGVREGCSGESSDGRGGSSSPSVSRPQGGDAGTTAGGPVLCGRCTVENEESVDQLTSWTRFAQRTTLHGLRVFCHSSETDKCRFTVRRCILLSIVFLNLVLFGYQIIVRVCTYLEYQSSVNLQFVFTDRLEFPSVTLCNHNNFRVTETVRRKMYDYIEMACEDEMFGTPGYEDSENQLQPPEENLTDFLLNAAHQKQDFIDSCTWRGETCNVNSDFSTTLTDFGVCYTFNHDRFKRRYVNQSGVRFALRLVLNIEQYEYMVGLQTEVGVRVRLHAANEVPLMRDLGVSIGPGTHTLLAIKTVVADDLTPPYGSCERGSQPRSVCMAQCQASQIADLCGCIGAFMPPIDNVSVCNVSSAFECVKREMTRLKSHAHAGVGCPCGSPCHRLQFMAQLSYAHLAKMNVQQLSEYDKMKFKKLQERYSAAREAAERVNKVIVQREQDLVSSVLNLSQSYQQNLKDSFLLLENDVLLRRRFGVSHKVTDDGDLFLGDLNSLSRDLKEKKQASAVRQPIVQNFINVVNSIEGFLEVEESEDGNWTSQARKWIEGCAAAEAGSSTQNQTVDSYYVCSDTKLFTYLWYKKQRISNTLPLAQNSKTEAEAIGAVYRDYTSYLYGNTTWDFRDGVRFSSCLDTMRLASKHWSSELSALISDLKTYTLFSTTWKTKLGILGRLEWFYDKTRRYDSLLSDAWFSVCRWPLNSDPDGREDDIFAAYIEATVRSFMTLKDLRGSLGTCGEKTLETVRDGLNSTMKVLEAFQESLIAKADLQTALTSLQFEVTRSSISIANDRYVRGYNYLISKLLGLESNIQAAFRQSFHLSQPVMNDTNLARLNLTAYSRELLQNISGLEELLDNLRTDREGSFTGIVALLYSSYRRAIQDTQTRFQQSFDQLKKSVAALQDDLKASVLNSQLSDNFFMENFVKLDIFFREMSYVSTQQQVAFDEPRLISEIGSLMGLLLGASLLSVCEFIDFIALCLVLRCQRKNRTWHPPRFQLENNKLD